MVVNLSLSTILAGLVVILLAIDLIYRIKFPKQAPAPDTVEKPGVLKEFFRDYKDQLSFTRLAIAVMLAFGFAIVITGLVYPQLWDKCSAVWDKLLTGIQALFTIGKAPEAVNQLTGIISGKSADTK